MGEVEGGEVGGRGGGCVRKCVGGGFLGEWGEGEVGRRDEVVR